MTEEIDGYAEDLDRLVLQLRDSLDKLSKAKEDRKGNVRRFLSLSAPGWCKGENMPLKNIE